MSEFHLRFGFPKRPIRDILPDIITARRLTTMASRLEDMSESILEEGIDRQKSGDPRLYRAHLLLEELGEYLRATADLDEVRAADAIGDLSYVVIGSAYTDGVPFENLFREIHRSNMTKRRHEGNERMRDKGPDYSPPDIRGVLDGRVGVDVDEKERSVPIGQCRLQVAYHDDGTEVKCVWRHVREGRYDYKPLGPQYSDQFGGGCNGPPASFFIWPICDEDGRVIPKSFAFQKNLTIPDYEIGPCGHRVDQYETEGDYPAGNWRTVCPACEAEKDRKS